jgi:hypothetical protein
MRPEAFERVDLSSGPYALPLRSSQGAAKRSSNIVHIGLLSCLAALVVVPQLALAAHALAIPDIRALILDRPLMAFELATAVSFWIAMFAWPLRRLYHRLTWRRDVEITGLNVAVRDERAFSGKVWSAPLASYKGIAHNVRTSLSTTRHELVLVHPEPDRSVLLLIAEHISESDIARMSQLLGLPHVSAKELYRTSASSMSQGDGRANLVAWHAAAA